MTTGPVSGMPDENPPQRESNRAPAPLPGSANPASSNWWAPDNFKGLGAGFCTVAVFIILGVWIVIVARTVGTAPTLDSTGKVVFDEFGNAKDILLAILPLATTSLGYWYGSQGTNDAKDDAAAAKTQAAQSAGEASSAKDQLAAVLDTAQPGALEQAKDKHADAFR